MSGSKWNLLNICSLAPRFLILSSKRDARKAPPAPYLHIPRAHVQWATFVPGRFSAHTHMRHEIRDARASGLRPRDGCNE